MKSTTVSQTVTAPTLSILSLNDWLFVEACLATIKKYGHLDRVEAWQMVWPTAKYTSASVTSHRKLKRIEIRQAIEAAIKADSLTKQSIMAVMWEAVEKCRQAGKYPDVLTGCMDVLKARGELVDKSEVKTIDENMVRRALLSLDATTSHN